MNQQPKFANTILTFRIEFALNPTTRALDIHPAILVYSNDEVFTELMSWIDQLSVNLLDLQVISAVQDA